MVASEVCAELGRLCEKRYAHEVAVSPQGLQGLYAECEKLLDDYHPDRGEHLDCKAGCGDCCIVNVSVLWPEAVAISTYLEHLSETDLAVLGERLDTAWTRIRGVEDEDRVCMRQPCVFLDERGRCAIYPSRPLLCRSVTSTDSGACRDSFHAYLHNEQRTVEMNLFQKELYNAAYLGLSRGLEEQDLDGRGFELTGLVRYLYKNNGEPGRLRQGLRIRWDELGGSVLSTD